MGEVENRSAFACGSEKNTQLVRALLSGIRSQGGKPRFVYKTGTADLNIVAPVWKCPAVVYGPGDSALDEYKKRSGCVNLGVTKIDNELNRISIHYSAFKD